MTSTRQAESSQGLSLAAVGLTKRFRTGFAVDVDRLTVEAGETLAVLGPSGSGKSTLLGLLGLLESPDAGTVLLGGRTVTARDRDARLSMAAVFQRPYLLKGSVAANVEYGLKLRRVPSSERTERASRALGQVGLAGFESRAAATLSGGEAQRVALARALVLEPRVLLLDEPLASLDPLLKRRLTSEFARILRDAGVTVVYVTHDHDEALVVADRVAIMNAGRVVAEGAASDVMGLPADEWTAEFLGIEAPGRGVVRASGDGLVRIDAGGAIVAAAGALAPGTEVLFAVAPEDVLLAESGADIGPTSARNRIECLVERIEPRGATWRVVMRLGGADGTAKIASSVSSAALAEMGLVEGAPAQAVFKATAVRVRAEESHSVEADTPRGIL